MEGEFPTLVQGFVNVLSDVMNSWFGKIGSLAGMCEGMWGLVAR